MNTCKPTKNINAYLTISLLSDPQKLSKVVTLGRLLNAKNRKERRGMSKNYHAEFIKYMIRSLGVCAHGIDGQMELYRGSK